jgi:hypothetical protein
MSLPSCAPMLASRRRSEVSTIACQKDEDVAVIASVGGWSRRFVYGISLRLKNALDRWYKMEVWKLVHPIISLGPSYFSTQMISLSCKKLPLFGTMPIQWHISLYSGYFLEEASGSIRATVKPFSSLRLDKRSIPRELPWYVRALFYLQAEPPRDKKCTRRGEQDEMKSSRVSGIIWACLSLHW